MYSEDIFKQEWDRENPSIHKHFDENSARLGWIMYQQWEERQNEMDRDYQEELNQQESLRRGA